MAASQPFCVRRGRCSEAGGSLVVTLIVALVLGLALVAYMSLLSSNQQAAAREEAWNGAIPLAEAGVEEALAHLNKNYPTNLTHAGWTAALGGTFERDRQFGATSQEIRQDECWCRR